MECLGSMLYFGCAVWPAFELCFFSHEICVLSCFSMVPFNLPCRPHRDDIIPKSYPLRSLSFSPDLDKCVVHLAVVDDDSRGCTASFSTCYPCNWQNRGIVEVNTSLSPATRGPVCKRLHCALPWDVSATGMWWWANWAFSTTVRWVSCAMQLSTSRTHPQYWLVVVGCPCC